MSEFTFFWDGPFSQWYPAKFKIDNIKYNRAEQWMMAEKARFFNDNATLNKIMKSNSPKEQKALGRTVKPFNEELWNKQVKPIIYKGNYAKFTQNKKLLDIFLATYPTILVEASPYDKLYGIGLDENDPKAQNQATWQGLNWLGEVLTELRNDLRLTHGL